MPMPQVLDSGPAATSTCRCMSAAAGAVRGGGAAPPTRPRNPSSIHADTAQHDSHGWPSAPRSGAVGAMAQAIERASASQLARPSPSSSSSEAELYLSACSDTTLQLDVREPTRIEDGGLEPVMPEDGAVHDVLTAAASPEAAAASSYTLDRIARGQLQHTVFFHRIDAALVGAHNDEELSLETLPHRESRPGTSDESTSRPAASESGSSTESSLLSSSSESEERSSTMLRNSTGQLSVRSAEDSGVVSDGEAQAHGSGYDSPWMRTYGHGAAAAFEDELTDVDGSDLESDGIQTPPLASHLGHMPPGVRTRKATPGFRLDKAPSSRLLPTVSSGKTRQLSPGHEPWSLNYLSTDLLQIIVDHLGPDATYPETDHAQLPGGPYIGHPAPKEAYQHRHVFDLMRWRSWFLSLRQLSRRFASAVFNSNSSWMAFIQLTHRTALNSQPGSPFHLARAMLQQHFCVVCMVPGQYVPSRGFFSKAMITLSLGKVPMCPSHAHLCINPGHRNHLACFNCLLVETQARAISPHTDQAGPFSKKTLSNLCSDCRRDLLEAQLMHRYGQQPLDEDVYDESLEVYAYLYEGARSASYAARKALEYSWLLSLWFFTQCRDAAIKSELMRRTNERLKRFQRRSRGPMSLTLTLTYEESDEDDAPETVWNTPEVRDAARRHCLRGHGREKLYSALWYSEEEIYEMPQRQLLLVSGPPMVPTLPIDQHYYGPGMPTDLAARTPEGRYLRPLTLAAPSRELRTEADRFWHEDVLPKHLALPLHNIARRFQQEHGQQASDIASRTTVQDLLVLLRHQPFWRRDKKAKKGFNDAAAQHDEPLDLPALPFSYRDVGSGTCESIQEVWAAESAFLSECICGICLRQKRKREADDEGNADRSGTAPDAAQPDQASSEERTGDSKENSEWEDAMGGQTPDDSGNLSEAEDVQAAGSAADLLRSSIRQLINKSKEYDMESEKEEEEEEGEEQEQESDGDRSDRGDRGDRDDDQLSDTSREAQEARARSCAEALSSSFFQA